MSLENAEELKFIGKVVSFGNGTDTLAIKDVSFEIQNGRLFAVGEVPRGATSNNWAQGCLCGVAWDSVTDYMVFENEDVYAKSLSKSEE